VIFLKLGVRLSGVDQGFAFEPAGPGGDTNAGATYHAPNEGRVVEQAVAATPLRPPVTAPRPVKVRVDLIRRRRIALIVIKPRIIT